MKFINQVKKFSTHLYNRGKTILISKRGSDSYVAWIILIIVAFIGGSLLIGLFTGSLQEWWDAIAQKATDLLNFKVG